MVLRLQKTANDQFISMGGGPSELVMKTKYGKTLRIVDAVGSVSVKVPNGGMITSVSISDQVTVVYQDKTMRVRIKCFIVIAYN